jgi:hypothetical protein
VKILHLSDGALSGAPVRLAQVQRLGGLEARMLNVDHAFGSRVYGHDALMDDGPDLVTRLLEEADVLHFHNWWRESFLFATYPWAWELARDKPSVIQFHTSRRPHHEASLAEPSLLKLVVAQYHVRFYPECRPMPNAVPIDDPLHRPLGVENDPPVVAFTPPQCEDTEGWGRKGARETLPVLESGFRHRFITEAPWEKAMRLRQECDIAIDEVVTGSYHMCSLESLSQGLATIAGLDAQTVDALELVTGTREHPWIVASPETLRLVLRELVEDDGFRQAKRREAREYMERHWNPAAIAARYLEVYTEALERSA